MSAQQPPTDRPNRRKTPAERADEFQATQARLKQEAAERRAASQNTPRASGSSHNRGRRAG
jgi:hypothetical protein